MTAWRKPYRTTKPLVRRPLTALLLIGIPLSMAFDVGAIGRTELVSIAGPSASIAGGVVAGQLGGTDSRPRVLAWPIPADTGVPWPRGPETGELRCGIPGTARAGRGAQTECRLLSDARAELPETHPEVRLFERSSHGYRSVGW